MLLWLSLSLLKSFLIEVSCTSSSDVAQGRTKRTGEHQEGPSVDVRGTGGNAARHSQGVLLQSTYRVLCA